MPNLKTGRRVIDKVVLTGSEYVRPKPSSALRTPEWRGDELDVPAKVTSEDGEKGRLASTILAGNDGHLARQVDLKVLELPPLGECYFFEERHGALWC
jgi:hypothetical protein